MRKTLQANLRKGKKKKHVLQYDDDLNDHDDVSNTRNPLSTKRRRRLLNNMMTNYTTMKIKE